MKAVERFINKLSSIQCPNAFNPYSANCVIHDSSESAQIRRENLRRALNGALESKARTIWIARDLGYLGGRRTGLALTDEAHLRDYGAIFPGVQLRKATVGPVVSERTATVIWRVLLRINQPVFLWNVFPLHPHEENNHFSNRSHSKEERNIGEYFIHAALDLIQPERVVCIGGDAERCLSRFGVSSEKVRHPSYGGQADFMRQTAELFGIVDQLGDLFTHQPPS
ncbi:uracil-DNA glycosylase [Hansschlegelia beijingensis]|uniref:Uracil-DNA glycosylase-like domain-containing protein n=1 Tax=Hansschlegelia beijingensis TaxID=1133344 RepID=A0A7W6CYM6_9HYPH|nr:uracil-DNA glycosylase [Hansschlegelia beijingensis]MBB3973493.1 hypothetical protein [Hansschlegelia beijingensis]